MTTGAQAPEAAGTGARSTEFLERHSTHLLGLLLLIALALRLPGIATWWLNPDEGIYFSVASWPSWSDFAADLVTEPHPPLYYTLLRGILHFGDSLFLLRLPSLLAWLFGIHALYLLTRQLLDKRSALMAALLLVVASYAWTSAVLIRSYSLWLCLQLYALAFLVQWVQTHRRRSLILSSLFWCLSLATHYFATTFMPLALLLVLWDQRRRSFPRQELRLLAWCALPILLLGILLFQFHFRAALLENAGQRAAQQRALGDAFEGGVALLSLFQLLAPPFAIFATCWLLWLGILRGWQDRHRLALFVLLFPLLQSIALWAVGLYPLSGSRHNYPLAVLLLPIIAVGCLSLFHRPWWPLLTLLGLLALGASWNWISDLGGGPGLPGRVIEQRIRTKTILDSPVWQRIRDGETLILDHQSFYPLLPLFYRRRPARDQVRGPAWHTTPHGKGKVLVSGAFELRGEPERMHEPDHLLGFLERIDRDAPQWHIFDRVPLLLVHAGWRGSVFEILRASKRLPNDPGFLLDEQVTGIFAWQTLDPARYRTFMLALEGLLKKRQAAEEQDH